MSPLLASLALAVFLAQLGATAVNVGLPSLMASFGVEMAAVQWVVLSYLLAVTALVVSVGRLGDLLGIQTPNNTAVMAAAPADGRGLVSSLLTLSRNLGFITGASVMASIFAVAMGADVTPDTIATGLRVNFEVATGLAAAALVLLLLAVR